MTAPLRIHALPHPDEPSDVQLVERALSGDRWAEEAIYRRHVHRVTTVAARLLRCRADVEDVVQDVFLTAFRDLASLRTPERLGSWLAASTVHRVHKIFRRRKLQRLLGLDRSVHDETLADQARDDVTPEMRAELAMIDRVLDRLADDDRMAWVLRHLLGYQVTEVAELTQCSLATVHRRLARAQERVDACFRSDRDA
ncbi:RNA polymerase sigma factor [Sandaracinus amylolyticus]|uniref:RNA polymerase sigma factor n=1 Tax=Sandaracinus amylolyticus TaxID=927083 RepID=UPI001F3382E5|nr:RNA polymerase sigma factor [Sandaracinus amylolyticus]UJR85047.1 Hypothetical protein I5071_71260 [Sandaracinus amylolyticus]